MEPLELLDAMAGRRVAVFGDFLLDRYIIGNSSRVSREAPIVVIDYERTVDHPGGAANAAQNAAALGGRVCAVGRVGRDAEGAALRALLADRGVDVEALLEHEGMTTPTKLRILAGELNAQKQQVARVDRSWRHGDDLAADGDLVAALERAVEVADAVLVSDYGMRLVPGALGERAIARARERGIPVVADSRFDLPALAGARVATPNEVEALSVLGEDDEAVLERDDVGRRLRERTGIDAFVVTRGSRGMLVIDGDRPPERIGIVGPREATDVTGAGDTVAAAIALALAAGASLVDAARLATLAAAVVVMKRGTATATPDEIRRMAAAAAS